MLARIYRPEKSATQSGLANTRRWVLEFVPEAPKRLDPLMGWVGELDTRGQVRMYFDTREEAEDYARRHGIPYEVVPEHGRRANVRRMGYADNFAAGRRIPWTH